MSSFIKEHFPRCRQFLISILSIFDYFADGMDLWKTLQFTSILSILLPFDSNFDSKIISFLGL